MEEPEDLEITASIPEFKKDPLAVVNKGHGLPVAVLNRNRPAFYCVPAEIYEEMLERLDDQELSRIVQESRAEQSIRVEMNNI